MGKKSVTKAGIGYTVGNILIKGISFLSLPLFTYYLTPADFGIYSTYNSYESIIAIIVSLGLYASVKAANIEFKGKIDSYVSTVIFLPFLFSFILCALSFPFRHDIALYLGFEDYSYLVLLLILQSLGSSVIMFYNGRISLDFSYKKYILLSFVSTFLNIGVSLLLILTICKKEPFLGRILGTSLPILFIGLCLVLLFVKKSKPLLDYRMIKFSLSYSLPLVPHGLSQIVLAQFGKIVIMREIGNFAAGIYGFTYTIALIPQILVASLDTAWGPWFFEKYAVNDVKTLKEKTDLYVQLFFFITLVFMSVTPEIVLLMGSKQYIDAVYITSPAILGVFFVFIYGIPAQIEYYYKKTVYLAIGTIIAAAFCVVLCIWLIPVYGYESAVYITIVTYIFYFIAHLLISCLLTNWTPPFHIMTLIKFSIYIVVLCVVIQALIDYWYYRYIILIFVSLLLYFKNKSYLHSLLFLNNQK